MTKMQELKIKTIVRAAEGVINDPSHDVMTKEKAKIVAYEKIVAILKEEENND